MSSSNQESANKKRKVVSSPPVDWNIFASDISIDTINPIREIVDKLNIPSSKEKPLIPLSIGDPTVFGNLPTPEGIESALIQNLKSGKYNGYCPSTGLLMAREAIAKKEGTDAAPLTPNDVIITSGCSGALVLAIQALCSKGDNILLPKPGFSLYATAAGHSAIECKYYDLDPSRQWECDLASMEANIDSRTKAILVNNPSNPTGSNYSEQHLRDVLAVAEKFKLPVIADEIYADMVFKGEKFFAMADLTTEVPVLSCRGLAKQYLVPGWRVGWISIHDRHDRFKETRGALQRLSQLILGASTLMQSLVPLLLLKTDESFYTARDTMLQDQANVLIDCLNKIDCLELIMPQGAMYLMVRIDASKFTDIKDETDFAQKLLDEELVFVLPGTCFNAPGFIRFVTCPPKDMLIKACARIAEFCSRHGK